MAREGSVDAPIRHPIDWQSPEFGDETALNAEMTRIFDICHGCRRCFNLCNAFPTLFDAIDESETAELDAVPKSAYWNVVEHCYLCDMCFMSKCPYVPPHEWNVDFPHLMLRAKIKHFADEGAGTRDRLLSSTERVGRFAGIPVIAQTVNAVNSTKLGRQALESTLGVHRDAPVPKYQSRSARSRLKHKIGANGASANGASPNGASANGASANGTPANGTPANGASAAGAALAGPTADTTGKVLVFATCYGNRNRPDLVEDLVAVLDHNGVTTALPVRERCCGMPKLELGDIESISRLKDENIEELYGWVEQGWDLTAAVPSCVLMFKQELPLLFPDDEKVKRVAEAFFDPFEYLMLRHKEGKLSTQFVLSLGKISYQVPCHLRVQNLGLKTRDLMQLIEGTEVQPIERCSGHDGTYAVKKEYHEVSRKIARPVVRQVDNAKADHFMSDCPMAAEQIATISGSADPTHPLQLLRRAYGI